MVRGIRPTSLLAAALLVGVASPSPSSPTGAAAAFASPGRGPAVAARGAAIVAGGPSSSAFLGQGMRLAVPTGGSRRGGRRQQQQQQRRGTGMNMFLGQDSGILGVGAPEIAVIVLVGYFILGPSELYKLTKEIGKTLQNFRSLSTEASKSFESTMENQLELEELRKAQRELNDAFSFRRSINTDESLDAFEEKQPAVVPPTETAAAAAATANIDTDAAPKRKKIKRRRVKKQPSPEEAAAAAANGEAGTGGQVPDLDMTSAFEEEKEAARLREERKARLASGSQPAATAADSNKPDWFDDRGVEDLMPSKEGGESSSLFGDPWAETKAEEQERFAAQLSGKWNDSVLQNEDKLEPLAKVMERLAILEEEKKAADLRLEEEFRLRGEMEEKFYKQKRKILEEAAAEVQVEAYAGMGSGGSGDGDKGSKEKEEEGSTSSSSKGKSIRDPNPPSFSS